jgi:hypothetical protein
MVPPARTHITEVVLGDFVCALSGNDATTRQQRSAPVEADLQTALAMADATHLRVIRAPAAPA